MSIDHHVYDTATLLGVLRSEEIGTPPPTYWLELGFNRQINFTDEYIDFEKVTENRKLAPLVLPTAQGVPIYSAATRAYRVKPAYVKPKDPVTASRMIKKQVGLGELYGAALSPQARYNAVVADIMRQHNVAIHRRWEWMASQAIIYGQITLEDEKYPKVVVDFLRNAANSITLAGGARWGQVGVSIMSSIDGMRQIVRQAEFGGPTNRLTVGPDVWAVMQADTAIQNLMKVDLRPYNGGININLGLREGLDVEYVGTLGGNLAVWVYADYYQDENGTVVPMLNAKDVVLTGTNIQGVRCFGAIQDVQAQFQAVPIFPKMWSDNDPSVTFIMNQSAPLMVPVNPNNTLRARVV